MTTAAPSPTPTTLLLLPGLACDAELFAPQGRALQTWAQAAGVRLAISTAHSRAATLPEMARLLLAEHPQGPLLLAGCSMGGMLAFELHRQAPQRIRGLALLGTTAKPDTPELIDLRSRACVLFAEGRMDEVLQANVMLAFHPRHARDAALTRRYLSMLHRAGAQQLINQNRAVMARVDSRPLLHLLDTPALVLCGEADLLTPPDCAREMAEGLPQAQLVLLPDTGHMLTWEAPERVTTLLLDWLQGLAWS
jgi:pimeloyl-ACP methyl ester carboxylesterase